MVAQLGQLRYGLEPAKHTITYKALTQTHANFGAELESTVCLVGYDAFKLSRHSLIHHYTSRLLQPYSTAHHISHGVILISLCQVSARSSDDWNAHFHVSQLPHQRKRRRQTTRAILSTEPAQSRPPTSSLRLTRVIHSKMQRMHHRD